MPDTDPTADAFMARILADPTDPLPRLVFADWLEETGTASNVAWARFLRLAEELATAPADDPRRPKLAGELDRVGGLVRARLTCRAEVLVAYPDAMLRLLPPQCIVANLTSVRVPLALMELLPESVARDSEIVPLAMLTGGTMLLAGHRIQRWQRERLEFILSRPVAFVGVADPDLTPCLDRHYGNFPVEFVVSVHYMWLPDDGLRGGPPELAGDPTVAFWNQLILDATVYIAPELQVEITGSRVAVWHIFPGDRRPHEYTPPAAVVARLIPTLRAFLRNTISDPAVTTHGEVTLTFWGQPRTHGVQIEDRPDGHSVRITIPPYPTHTSVALNPAA